MSIALTGQIKYDFQDLVCVHYILKFYDKNGTKFLVEPEGGEDAELCFLDDTGQSNKFEIQVKGSEEPVDHEKVAECLGHFPAYGDNNFLLERLLLNKNSRAVLVMSGRATDSLQKYLPKGDWQGGIHKTTRFNQPDAQLVLNAVREYARSLPETRKNNARRNHIVQFFESVSINDIKESLSRLIIIDNTSKDNLTDSCRRILRSNFQVPDDMFNHIINGLSTIIKDGKLSQKDTIAPFLQYLNENPVLSIRPKNYIQRDQEGIWVEQLKTHDCLLLSGRPRVGKSNSAKWIASEFQCIGYSVLLTQHVDEAERFLLDPVHTPRLVVLDDPLGGIHPVNKPNESLGRLKRLITNLRKNRKLIVSQGQERLLEVTETEMLTDASIEGRTWVDLSDVSVGLLLSHWDTLGREFSISKNLFNTVRNSLIEGKINIELGCLTYLAAENEKINDTSNIDQILRFARKDAVDLGKALDQEGCKNILMGLAITSSNLEPVSETDLAYSLANSEENFHGYSDIVSTYASFGKTKVSKTHIFPKYQPKPKLSQDDSDSLDLLEQRCMAEFNDSDEATFSHPFYRSAAESLFNFKARKAFPRIEQILENGIFCLSPSTARASARNLNWIYERVKKDSDKIKVFELAKRGLNSSYPSVRDICFEFLIDNMSRFPDECEIEQSKWINKVNGGDLQVLEWLDGQPWYPMGKGINLEYSWSNAFGEDKSINILSDIHNDTLKVITPKDAFDVLTYLENKPEELTHSAISRILSINEGLVRALAVKIWLQINRENDCDILARIFSDKHPAVAESIFKSTIRSWNEYNFERQNYFFSELVKLAAQPVLANAIIDDLVVFERPHRMGENPPWEVFAKLLPIALSSLPHNVNLKFTRLDCVVNEAIRILDLELTIPIIDGWITLLEKISIKKIPDDYALAVTDTLIKITKSNDEARRGLISRLLSLNGTGGLVRVISDLMYDWDVLTNEEQELVIERICMDSEDRYWRQAAVLTSRRAPNELIKLIIPNWCSQTSDMLQAEELLDLPPKLLSSAVKMYIGEPQPLWWIGTHHREQNVWPRVIELIAQEPSHPLFKQAFNQLLSHGACTELCSVINNWGASHSDVFFELMFQYKLDTSGEFMPEVWEALFQTASSETCSKWIEQMASHSLTILDSLYEAKEWVPKEFLNKFYSHFESDELITKALVQLSRVKAEMPESLTTEYLQAASTLIMRLFAEEPPLHYDTCDFAKEQFYKLGYSSHEVQFIQERRDELMKELDMPRIYNEPEKITDWVF
ncbi:hypothetical protein [Pseudoalteromonas sp. S1608]|uniref:nSTAND3 domain-containing NTPase n=1 Tax=Pseudoalteromonas sp. S1608 TaxID=579504 RepID=UPI00110A8C6F|nr:hypothetical protein [Pseudoalteromonas sp. S1608]TMP73759.1 hypothetical protein CWB75_13150 [Pseudoalteromonas sp. S1608]